MRGRAAAGGRAVFAFGELRVPLVLAPMTGGPSTPALAAAVSGAGGLGFVAAGYRSAAWLAEEIHRTRRLTAAPFGVNLFVPQPSVADAAELAAYAARLEGELDPAEIARGVRAGVPHPDDDDWAAKLEVLFELRPAVASFTFGCPDAETLQRLAEFEVLALVTVTTVAEARLSLSRGAPAFVAQGPEAGGHRGTFDPAARPDEAPLETLLGGIRHLTDAPVVAAGGIADAAGVRRMLERRAVAAQVGTAFLLAREAGTNAVQRAALAEAIASASAPAPSSASASASAPATEPGAEVRPGAPAPGIRNPFDRTAVTHAFSGRPARGLVNDFMRRQDGHAPLGFPEVNQLTTPLRAAALAAGDPHGIPLWAGTGFRSARSAPAAEIVHQLTKGLAR